SDRSAGVLAPDAAVNRGGRSSGPADGPRRPARQSLARDGGLPAQRGSSERARERGGGPALVHGELNGVSGHDARQLASGGQTERVVELDGPGERRPLLLER